VRAGRQEEPEFGVDVRVDDLVDDAFEFRHEGNAQMAVGQMNPITFLGAVLQELQLACSLWPFPREVDWISTSHFFSVVEELISVGQLQGKVRR